MVSLFHLLDTVFWLTHLRTHLIISSIPVPVRRRHHSIAGSFRAIARTSIISVTTVLATTTILLVLIHILLRLVFDKKAPADVLPRPFRLLVVVDRFFKVSLPGLDLVHLRNVRPLPLQRGLGRILLRPATAFCRRVLLPLVVGHVILFNFCEVDGLVGEALELVFYF